VSPPPPATLQSNRFEILDKIGAGGMGLVYLARDKQRNARVAIKALPDLDPEALLLFKREFRSLQDVQHRNLVGLGELFEENGSWYFTLEYIDGVDLLKHVRPSGPRVDAADLPTEPVDPELTTPRIVFEQAGLGFDEDRLRSSLCQIAEGLTALHSAGKVHRDIKPSNVMVTKEGRVVVLDFGLVHDLTDASARSDVIAGTVPYMAPEQATTSRVGPAADWYSVGVILYQVLTGTLPFGGPPAQVLLAKRRFVPPPPRERAPNVPRDLEALCMSMLHIDPARRPSGPEVLSRLRAAGEPSARIPIMYGPNAPFVGRETEVKTLLDGLRETRSGRAIINYVVGESGVGKSTVVKRFAELAAKDQGAVVFHGRCYSRESIRYKAFDGIIDELTEHLRKDSASAVILPTNVGYLSQVFPVMQRVKAIAEATTPTSNLDAVELRARVFEALHELFGNLASLGPVVLVIDDLQWADPDSLALLSSVLRSPAPPIFIVATVRTDGQEILSELSALFESQLVRVKLARLELAPLSEEHGRELADALFSQVDVARSSDLAKHVARESHGHPLFIQELVRSALEQGEGHEGSFDLVQSIATRLMRLEPFARRILEIVSLAGVPLPEAVLAHAARCDAATLDANIRVLMGASFIRTALTPGERSFETYHDRVREGATSVLAPEETKERHRRIAEALEELKKGDAETRAVHWAGAGESKLAAVYASDAAAAAMEALAFHNAARLYRLSLDLRQPNDPDRHRLGVARGDALAKAGLGAESAAAYLEAAKDAPGEEAVALRRLAADQLFRVGHVDQGLEVLDLVLPQVGIELPSSPQQARRAHWITRAQIALAMLLKKKRDPEAVPPGMLVKVDTCWSLQLGLAMMHNPAYATYFESKHLLLAIQSGDGFRTLRALMAEVVYSACAGRRHLKRLEKMSSLARKFAEKSGHPYAIALLELTSAMAMGLSGRWREAQAGLKKATEFFRERASGSASWEIMTSALWNTICGNYAGDFAALRESIPALVREAERTANKYVLAFQKTYGSIVHVAADDPNRARKEIAEAMSAWTSTDFHIQQYWELIAFGQTDLYAGETRAAFVRISERWPALDRSLLLWATEQMKIEAYDLRTRIFLAEALRREARERSAILGSVAKDARVLEKTRAPWALAIAKLVRAELVAARSSREAALPLLQSAIPALEAAELPLYTAAARFCEGEILGGDAGQEKKSAAAAILGAHGIQNPKRYIALLTPGFGST
jgi:eukaryotic-like serine/threonine-protein kinase